MSAPTSRGAVFLSYAREDAVAARRIADALRSHGVEVWFDEHDLRGGDAWDQKIKTQIRKCALFLPVVSAYTQERAEGYFRREWRLAADRTHDMADGVPFLAPVAIDDTPETGAAVPVQFLSVQWTRLPGALPTPQFVDQVKQLLAAPRKPAHAPGAKSGDTPTISPQHLEQSGGRRTWRAVAAGLAVAALAAIAYFMWPARERPSAEKSIAVLPFVNMSADRDNEYLSDGITEEILNALAKVPGLRVPARTSSFVFKDRKEDIKRIGELLHVKTVLEGSVRKAGAQLRVTAQLINVADGFHLWSETYDREMTNVLAIQDDIARTVVAKLRLTLVDAARPMTRGPTNIDAYQEVLNGRFHAQKFTESGLKLAISHYRAALALEPDYAPAWAGLSGAYSLIRYFAYAAPAEVTSQFREATSRALQLDDTLSDAHLQQAGLHVYVDRDFRAAEEEYKRALSLDPGNVGAHFFYALYLGAMGRHAEAVTTATKAGQLDPLSVNAAVMSAWTRVWAGDFEGALQHGRRALGMAPDYFNAHEVTAHALYRLGRVSEAVAQLEKACTAESPPQTLGMLGTMYGRAGRRDDARRILDQLLEQSRKRYVPAFTIARVYDGLGDVEQTNVWTLKAIADHEGRVVYLKASADEITRANPHFREWLTQLGFEP